MYPTKMKANGNIYPINTDYRIALACFRAMEDDSISDLEKGYAIETLLLGDNVSPLDEPILNEKIKIYLRCGKEQNEDIKNIDYDYLQDEQLTRTSIRQCYHINLNEIPYMHWWEYNEIISGLTNDSVINCIRDLRSRDASEIKDDKERNKLIEAQKRVAIKDKHIKTDEEKELDEFWDNITGGEQYE